MTSSDALSRTVNEQTEGRTRSTCSISCTTSYRTYRIRLLWNVANLLYRLQLSISFIYIVDFVVVQQIHNYSTERVEFGLNHDVSRHRVWRAWKDF